jgi:hypothetical protein
MKGKFSLESGEIARRRVVDDAGPEELDPTCMAGIRRIEMRSRSP